MARQDYQVTVRERQIGMARGDLKLARHGQRLRGGVCIGAELCF